jgi:hypothetical protein
LFEPLRSLRALGLNSAFVLHPPNVVVVVFLKARVATVVVLVDVVDKADELE